MFNVGNQEYKVQYLPGESNTGMFGGNSNWRGPVWMPVNALIIRALLNLYNFYGDEFKVQCPTGSGRYMTLFEVAQEISRRLASSFLRDDKGRRPVYGGTAKFQNDPHWRDLILSTSISMETTERVSAPVTRRAGQVWSRAYSTCSGASTPKIWSWNANKLSAD